MIKSHLKHLIAAFLIAPMMTLCPKSWANENAVFEQANPYVNIQKLTPDNLLVLQINLGGFLILDEPVIGYNIGDEVFLSLKDFVRVLELPIQFTPNNMSATGWFIDEDKIFSLDLQKNQIIAGKKKFTTTPEDLVLYNGDIFVDSKILQKWFGLELAFHKNEQEIGVNSGGLLPIEARFERQQQWKKLADEKQSTSNKTEDLKDSLQTPYKLASVPFGDLTYRQNYSKSNDTATSSSQINGLFTGDFLYLNNQISTTIQDGVLTNARVISGRRDKDGKLLGPLGATEFSLGDIFTPEQPLIARAITGKGAIISNYPLEYVNQFNKVNIRGNAQVNWDVEIYRNDSLFDFQKVANNGIYEFTDVPLISGLNIITLIFYGPFGQRYKETRRFMVGNDLLQENKVYYRFAANKNNDNLIQSADQNAIENDSQGVGRFFGELGFGLTKTTSIVANFLRIPVNLSDQQNDYTSLSLRSSLFGISGRFDFAHDLKNKTNAQQASLQTEFFNYNLSTTFDNFDQNFISEDNPLNSDPIVNRTSIRLDGPLTIPFMTFPSRISITGIKENFVSKQFRDNFDNEISFGLSSKISLTQGFEYIYDGRIEGDTRKIINGRTLFNYSFSEKLIARSGLTYRFQPSQDLNTFNLSLSYNFGNNFNASYNIDHQFAQVDREGSTNYSASVSKTFNKVIVSLGGNYIDNGNYGANLNLSTSFGYDPIHNTGVISGIPLANSGAISAKVFIDDNNNGIFDKGEEPLKNVEIFINDGVKRTKTNQDGVAFITNLQVDNASKVAINNDSLPDPYLLVRKNAVKVFAHSGTIADIDFAVLRVGEISGYAILNKNGGTSPASNVEMQLIDKEGNIVATTKSGYDGFYLFEMVPFNSYKLQISDQQSARLGFVLGQKYDLELNNEHQTIEKLNFKIQYKPN